MATGLNCVEYEMRAPHLSQCSSATARLQRPDIFCDRASVPAFNTSVFQSVWSTQLQSKASKATL